MATQDFPVGDMMIAVTETQINSLLASTFAATHDTLLKGSLPVPNILGSNVSLNATYELVAPATVTLSTPPKIQTVMEGTHTEDRDFPNLAELANALGTDKGAAANSIQNAPNQSFITINVPKVAFSVWNSETPSDKTDVTLSATLAAIVSWNNTAASGETVSPLHVTVIPDGCQLDSPELNKGLLGIARDVIVDVLNDESGPLQTATKSVQLGTKIVIDPPLNGLGSLYLPAVEVRDHMLVISTNLTTGPVPSIPEGLRGSVPDGIAIGVSNDVITLAVRSVLVGALGAGGSVAHTDDKFSIGVGSLSYDASVVVDPNSVGIDFTGEHDFTVRVSFNASGSVTWHTPWGLPDLSGGIGINIDQSKLVFAPILTPTDKGLQVGLDFKDLTIGNASVELPGLGGVGDALNSIVSPILKFITESVHDTLNDLVESQADALKNMASVEWVKLPGDLPLTASVGGTVFNHVDKYGVFNATVILKGP